MAETKTKQTAADVTEFINSFAGTDQKRSDSFELVKFFRSLTGFEPKMWGPTIIGFGSYHYQYASGHQGDAPLAAFSPRKTALVLYFATEFKDRELLLAKLGQHTRSKACVYVKKLSDIDLEVLQTITVNSMATVQE